MTQFFPPIRLVGAEVLRDGQMQARSVAIENGVISKGPLPEVNLRGYLILPGIVDLAARPLRLSLSDPADAVRGLDRAAASFGITTLWSAQDWSWAGGSAAPHIARRVAQTVAEQRTQTGSDLRTRLICDVHMMDTLDQLSETVRAAGVDQVIFADGLTPLLSQTELRREEICRQAALAGLTPDLHLETLRALSKRQREVPRFLCQLAEAFDRRGVIYGSLSDSDGETREMYSMIGAKLCLKPRVRAAAALARAVGDPVVLAARDVAPKPPGAIGLCAMTAIREGQCTALASDGGFDALGQAAFAVADRGGLGLPEAWNLVSKNPAEIMRLPDRGVIDYGRRADLVVVDAATRRVEATIAAGRLTYLTGEAANRFLGAPAALDHAAE